MTAEMYGAPWKIMMNVHSLLLRRIVDLKTTRSILEKVWDEAARRYVSFVELYKAPLQVAIYSEVERLAMRRAAEDWSEFLIVAVSKEKYPDKAVLNMTNPTRLGAELAAVEAAMPRIKGFFIGHIFVWLIFALCKIKHLHAGKEFHIWNIYNNERNLR